MCQLTRQPTRRIRKRMYFVRVSSRWSGSQAVMVPFAKCRSLMTDQPTREGCACSHDLSLRSSPPPMHLSRDLAGTLNEPLDHRAEGSILQRHDRYQE